MKKVNMNARAEMLQAFYELYNKTLFNNELPTLPIRVVNDPELDYCGIFDIDAIEINLEPHYNLSEIFGTLIHEMVHAWQWYILRWDKEWEKFVAKKGVDKDWKPKNKWHGKVFKKKVRQLERITGFGIER